MRPARDGAFLAGIVFAVMIGLGLLPFAVDAHAYWAADPLDPYSNAALSDFDAYFYSPAFTQAIWPLHWLPWPIFAAIWTAAIVVALRWLSGLWLGLVMLLPPVFIEVAMGNIHAFLAVAIVVGFRWPVTWAFVLLTKVTPGVGLLWFAARREWRNLASPRRHSCVVPFLVRDRARRSGENGSTCSPDVRRRRTPPASTA